MKSQNGLSLHICPIFETLGDAGNLLDLLISKQRNSPVRPTVREESENRQRRTGSHPNQRGKRTQSQIYQRRYPQKEVSSFNWGLRLRQILSSVRHTLRGRPEEIRRIIVSLCTSIFGPNGEAEVRDNPRVVAHYINRTKNHFKKPSINRRHNH